MNDMNIIKPNYFDHFKCIASECEDNCCMGWSVDIDEKSYRKYLKISEEPLLSVVKRSLKQNPNCDAPEINFGYVKLTKAKNCAFLDSERLCLIQKHKGETYLSNVCRLYPRILNRVNGQFEISLSPSCPEALRQFLMDEKGLLFEKGHFKVDQSIITYDVKEGDVIFQNTPVQHFTEIRNQINLIFKDSQMSFRTQLYWIGAFIWDVKSCQHKSRKNILKTWQDRKLNRNFQSRFLYPSKALKTFEKTIFDVLDVQKHIFSDRYRSLHFKSQAFYKGATDRQRIDAERRFEVFAEKHAYVFENYYLNLSFRNLFPFTEAEDIFEAYLLYVARLVIMQSDLTGLIGSGDTLDEEMLIRYFQSFSKAIEHHQSFFYELLETLKAQKNQDWNFIKSFSEEV